MPAYVDPVELQLRRQLEQALGRSVSDIEWESFKRAASQTTIENSAPKAGHAWEWTGRDRVACFAALLALLAGIGMSLEADFMFSPAIRIPLGVGLWLLVLVMVRWFLSALFFVLIWLLPAAAVGGWDMLFRDRDYLTSTHGWTVKWIQKGTTPAELIAGVLIAATLFLGSSGLPARSGRR